MLIDYVDLFQYYPHFSLWLRIQIKPLFPILCFFNYEEEVVKQDSDLSSLLQFNNS